MKPEDIKAAIVRAGTTQAAIAVHLHVSVQSVGRVISGRMRSARIEAELQKITGKPLHESKASRGRKKSVWTGAMHPGAAA